MNTLVEGHEVDAYWPEHRLAVELDSRRYHLTTRNFESDRQRDVILLKAGVRTARITDKRLSTAPQAVAQRSPGAACRFPYNPFVIGSNGGERRRRTNQEVGMRYLLLIYGDESNYGQLSEEEIAGRYAALVRIHGGDAERRGELGRRGPAAGGHRDQRPQRRRRRRAARDRRPVRGDQGAARRLLPARRAATSTRRSSGRASAPALAYGMVELRPIMEFEGA